MKTQESTIFKPTSPDNSTILTLNQWYFHWMRNYKIDIVKPSTLQNYACIYHRHIKEPLGNMPIVQITSAHIRQMYKTMQVSPKYQHCIHSILSNMFETTLQNDLVGKNPCRDIKLQPLPHRQQRILSIQEQNALTELMQKPHWYDCSLPIIVLLGTGMRVGELLGLTWENVNFDQNSIYIEKTLLYLWDDNQKKYTFSFQSPKTTHSIRHIPMSGVVKSALLRQSEKQHASGTPEMSSCSFDKFADLVFTNRCGHPMQRRDIQKILNHLIQELNQSFVGETSYYIEHIHPHTLRHSFATRCFEAGIAPKIIQTLLGHSSIQVTMDLYTHVSNEICQESIKKLERFGM